MPGCRKCAVLGNDVRVGSCGGTRGRDRHRKARAGVSRAGAQKAGLLLGRGAEALQYKARMWGQAEGLFTTCQNILQEHRHIKLSVPDSFTWSMFKCTKELI